MKKVFLILALFPQSYLFAEVSGLTVKNSHLVAQAQGKVFRGSEPLGKEKELSRLGITDVLIFKNDTHGEVGKEQAGLTKANIKNIYKIPFEWKKSANEASQCRHLIDALGIVAKVYQTTGRAIFFHCTVGEDRTGMLAGLFKMMVARSSAKEVFQNEMCARGYEAGNEDKPKHVVDEIRAGLTPLFLRMAASIDKGELSLQRIDKRICDRISQIQVNSAAWACSADR
jgi:hypothetical protein